MGQTTHKIKRLFEIKNYGLTILMDQYASIFWHTEDMDIKPLSDLPWELQAPFFLTFLHNNQLAERFKNCEIVGAIDIYLKSKYFYGEELILLDKYKD